MHRVFLEEACPQSCWSHFEKVHPQQLLYTFWHSSGHNKAGALPNECTLWENSIVSLPNCMTIKLKQVRKILFLHILGSFSTQIESLNTNHGETQIRFNDCLLMLLVSISIRLAMLIPSLFSTCPDLSKGSKRKSLIFEIKRNRWPGVWGWGL